MNERILEKFIVLNGGIENEGMVSLILDLLIIKVKKYCNIDSISEELEYLIAEMLLYYYKTFVKPEVNTGEIKAITRGSTKIEYNVSSTSGSSDINDVISKFKKDLMQFRKVAIL